MTAAHVIAGHGEITVTSGPGEETEHRSLATPVWSHLEEGRVDLAVLELADPAGDVPTVGFGRLSDRAAVVEAQAMGYPRWKFRDDDHKYREAAHVTGKIPVLANRRSGTLEFIVPPPGRDPDPRRSPWGGFLIAGGQHQAGRHRFPHRTRGLSGPAGYRQR